VLVFHGAREEVVPFFKLLGFQLPPRKGIADFLQEINSRKDQKVWGSTAHTLCFLTFEQCVSM